MEYHFLNLGFLYVKATDDPNSHFPNSNGLDDVQKVSPYIKPSNAFYRTPSRDPQRDNPHRSVLFSSPLVPILNFRLWKAKKSKKWAVKRKPIRPFVGKIEEELCLAIARVQK